MLTGTSRDNFRIPAPAFCSLERTRHRPTALTTIGKTIQQMSTAITSLSHSRHTNGGQALQKAQ